MPVTPPPYLQTPLYFPDKPGYGQANEVTFRGLDAKYIVHDFELLKGEIDDLIIIPPGTPNLEQVLIQGDDANGQNIEDVGQYHDSSGSYIELSHNGDGNVTIESSGGTVTLGGDVLVDGDIMYSSNNTFDIGSATFAPKDVYVATTVFTNSIKEKTANGLLIIGVQAGSTGTVRLIDDPVGQGGLSLRGHGGVTITNVNTAGKNIDIVALGAGSEIIATSQGGVITLTPSTGFAACTGTENKAGFDADNVIFTAGALQDLARSVAALWNATFTKGYIGA